MTIGSMSGAKIAAAPSAVLIIYAGALLQGTTLVSFPAVSAMLKQTLALSDAEFPGRTGFITAGIDPLWKMSR